ncbi:MAG: TIGR02391 family protein, partial [Verrucomicrobiota bacterium JB022]|nr:TIGR02391 family protein [Verrucomicrobiota bacterium JB022]
RRPRPALPKSQQIARKSGRRCCGSCIARYLLLPQRLVKALFQQGARACIDAILRFIHFGDVIDKAVILTHESGSDCTHAIYLSINGGLEEIIVKAGFASGYPGEGPGGLAYVLSLLEALEVPIDESVLDGRMFQKIENCTVTSWNLEKLIEKNRVRPHRYSDYIYGIRSLRMDEGRWQTRFPVSMPYSLIDDRLIDLAVQFRNNPKNSLNNAHTRLEDTIRKRIESEEHGSKLFSEAFLGKNSKLEWEGLSDGVAAGRAKLFSDVYSGFRNRRMHREFDETNDEQLYEFLLVNQLFRLEAQAKDRVLDEPETQNEASEQA